MNPEGLEVLLQPVTVERFFAEHWGQRPLHVAGRAGKFADIYDRSRFSHVECFAELQAATRDGRGRQVEFAIVPAQVQPLFYAGLTICADVSADPGVARFLRSFAASLPLAGAPFARLYASPDDGGFAVHADKFHVFVLQIDGQKEWRFSQTPAVPDPLDGLQLDERGDPVLLTGERLMTEAGLPVAPPDVKSFTRVVLAEGDCLYLPPGTWHQARALGHSLAVSVSPPRASVFHLVARALEDQLTARSAWRQDVVAAPAERGAPGRVPRSIEELFADRLDELKRLVNHLDPRALHRLWRINSQLGGAALRKGPTPQSSPPITSTDVLEHASAQGLQFLVAPAAGGVDAIFFYEQCAEWALPIEALGFVTALAQHPKFKAELALSWDARLGWPKVSNVLWQLVEAGVLRVCTGQGS